MNPAQTLFGGGVGGGDLYHFNTKKAHVSKKKTKLRCNVPQQNSYYYFLKQSNKSDVGAPIH